MNSLGQILYFIRWGSAIIFVGLVVGVMSVIFPPLATVGVVALVGVVLVWALPEFRVVPEKALRKAFYALVVVLLCVPGYYALVIPFLPWISLRRIVEFAVIILFSITVAGSSVARGKISESLRSSRWLAICAIGFLVMNFLSIFTSAFWPFTVDEFSEMLLNWYVPLFACILIVRSDEDVVFLLKLIMIASIIVVMAGLIEFVTWRRLYLSILPENVLSAMVDVNPLVADINQLVDTRHGLWRASSLYISPLSFGEFSAMIAPIGAYFLLHGNGWRERALGIVTGTLAMLGVVCSGARGGYVAFLVAVTTLSLLWTIRYKKLNPHSLIAALMFFIFIIGWATVGGAVMFWPRIHAFVLGGDETAASDNGRIEQWVLAEPHIFSNPLTGHGAGMAAKVVGWRTQGGLLTLDSYIATLLVEVGVPGLLLFLGMLVIAIFIGARVYLSDADRRATVAGPLACCILAFLVYRMTLSRFENHILLFLMIGLMITVSKLTYDRWTKTGYTPFPNSRAFQRYPAAPSQKPAQPA